MQASPTDSDSTPTPAHPGNALDDTYGRLIAPQPRPVSGQAYDSWENEYTPASLIIEFRISNGYESFSWKHIFKALWACGISIIYAKLNKLDVESAKTMRALVDHVAAGCPINTTLMNDVIFIWVVDRTGEIFVATEELVLDYLPTWLVKHQTMRLTRGENKLGHPALISCEAGRIGGEIKFLRASQTRKNDLWVINNGSGRYGLHPNRTEKHLSNVAARFLSFGMKFLIDFIQPRVPARVI
jgi:hypothetical protein